MLIKKVYKCGNSMGIVYRTDDGEYVSTLVGKWDRDLAEDGMKYDGVCRGKAARKLYGVLEGHIESVRERKAREACGGVEPATERQVDYAYDLTRRVARDYWPSTLGASWFKRPPTRQQIAALGKDRCSQFISSMVDRY